MPRVGVGDAEIKIDEMLHFPLCREFVLGMPRIEIVFEFDIFFCFDHTCHKLWTEICEIRQIFRGDLIKFCNGFTKITFELPLNSQKPLFICKKLLINTTKCDLCSLLHKM